MDELDKKWVIRIAIVFFGGFLVGKGITILLNFIFPNSLTLFKGMITPMVMILGLLAVLYIYSRDKYDK